MTVQYLTDVKGKKKGVFLNMTDWQLLQKKLDALHIKLTEIEKKRKEILTDYKKSKTEKHHFSSNVDTLKASLK